MFDGSSRCDRRWRRRRRREARAHSVVCASSSDFVTPTYQKTRRSERSIDILNGCLSMFMQITRPRPVALSSKQFTDFSLEETDDSASSIDELFAMHYRQSLQLIYSEKDFEANFAVLSHLLEDFLIGLQIQVVFFSFDPLCLRRTCELKLRIRSNPNSMKSRSDG